MRKQLEMARAQRQLAQDAEPQPPAQLELQEEQAQVAEPEPGPSTEPPAQLELQEKQAEIAEPEPGPSTSRTPDTPPAPMERLIIPISSPMPASPEEELPLTRSQKKLALFQRCNIEEHSDINGPFLSFLS
ncbi:hypothetical protein ElyMa_003735900 [Elysia marginata]|uniref:Uncharacterized protein n=1 Tax=Elysia marginata TaxID=1093978 RepID=A0AAV4F7B2_9GAST|nr:hypothetical protein ElyMa_003735900 [Elysia marginata]